MKKDSVIYYIVGAIVVGLAIAYVAGIFFSDNTEKSARVFFEKVLLPSSINNWKFDKFKEYYGRKQAPAEGSSEDEKLRTLFSISAERLGSLTSFSGIASEKTEYIDIESGKTVFVDLSADAVFSKGSARLKTRLVQSENAWRVLSFDVISAALVDKPAEQTAAPAASSDKKTKADQTARVDAKKIEYPASQSGTPAPVEQKSAAVQSKKSEADSKSVQTSKPAEQPRSAQKSEPKKPEAAVPAPTPAAKPSVEVSQPQQTKNQPAELIKPQPKSEEKAAKESVAAVQAPKPVSYAYDAKNRRDPFYPLIVKQDTEKKPGLTPLENYEISDFKLIAILREKVKGYFGVVTLPNNKSYNLREGVKIGMNGGKVIKIEKDSVVIREYHRDLKGVLSPKDTILKLRREEEG
ncbi:MAG: pilus assembly protein PilP [Dissulfurispiraceae bacterium]|jgi:Tfp pilus assembly protein PilP|nr:pilus assembly protein PilP [Dissulfurispiraceae bacterium]